MKKTALAAALLAVMPVAAQADLLFTVGAKASVWNVEPTGQLDDGVSVEDDGLNLDSENGSQITVFFEHPVPFIPNLKLKQTSLELEGDGAINASFGDVTFSEDVTSTMDLSHTDLTLYWGLPLPIPFVDINFGLTARQFDGKAEVTGATAGTESVDLDFVLPLVYGEVKVDTPFGVYGHVDINYVGYGKNKLSDMSYGLGYDLPIPVVDIGLEAGYRKMTLQTDEDNVDIAADVDIGGMYYGASLSLGF
ncbi:TIGR04219 family outer membrane beta-barrel protein [Thalassolituus sp. LLYu03]|uniref:TIGR04219 family outer membrane beta-barrel protein n=1 Tax=Thalassolituus sp. LLYu03 TaxID=3421656 RepID=UPI003D272040